MLTAEELKKVKDIFPIQGSLEDVLKGEVIDVNRIDDYTRDLRDLIKKYEVARENYENGKPEPGTSSPMMGGLGARLQDVIQKGMAARARYRVADWMLVYAEKNLGKDLEKNPFFKLDGKAPDDFHLSVNYADILEGEIIYANKAPSYLEDFKDLKKEYTALGKKNKGISGGKARGMGGYEQAQVGKDMRLAQTRYLVAVLLAKRGLSKVKY